MIGVGELAMMVDFENGKDDKDALDARRYIHWCLELRCFNVAKKKTFKRY